MPNINEEITSNHHFNIIDIMLIDHANLKRDIILILNDNTSIEEKIEISRNFIKTLKKHTKAKQQTVYDSLSEMQHIDDIHNTPLSSIVPFERISNEDITSEINHLANIVKHHIEREEEELFPKLENALDDEILNEIGFQYIILRKFSPEELDFHPELKNLIYPVKIEKTDRSLWSGFFVKQVNRYISSLISQSWNSHERFL